MKDLKLIGRNEEELRNEIRTLKTISNDIKMEHGLEKCTRVSLKSGKVHRKQNRDEIKELESMKAYKYLGVEESHNTESKNEKEKLKNEYLSRF
jgi:predicted Mrr-cat superfamily restriction endonuclease